MPKITIKKSAKSTAKKMPFREVLNNVLDPELAVGIVDLGLIYEVKKKAGSVMVIMTLTSMGCPLGPQITGEMEKALKAQKGVKKVKIEIVWDPPWNPGMMNPEIKTILFGNNNAADPYQH